MIRIPDMVTPGGVMASLWRASLVLLLVPAMAARAEIAAADKLAPAGPPAPSQRLAAERPTGNSLESIPIAQRPTASPNSTLANSTSPSVFNPWRIVGALAFVLAAIFGVRWAGRRFLGLPTTRSSSGAIQVLCRSILSPRQQLMLVQVGRRMVLVADCGTQMNALCEISDPDEVAALAGQVQQRKSDSGSGSFLSSLGRAEAPYEASGAAETQDHEQESAGPATAGEDAPETALATTREELTGLLQKVRLISRHFRRA